MDELNHLRELILHKEYEEALDYLEELDDMSRKGNIRVIRKQAIRLMAHLIKRSFEKRMTNSWLASIADASQQVDDINDSRDAANRILDHSALLGLMEESYDDAVLQALIEIDEGQRTAKDVLAVIDQTKILNEALEAITDRSAFLQKLTEEKDRR